MRCLAALVRTSLLSEFVGGSRAALCRRAGAEAYHATLEHLAGMSNGPVSAVARLARRLGADGKEAALRRRFDDLRECHGVFGSAAPKARPPARGE